MDLSTPAPFADYQCCTEGSSFAGRNSKPFTLDSVSVIKWMSHSSRFSFEFWKKKNSENLFKMITNRQVLDQIVEWLAPKRNTSVLPLTGTIYILLQQCFGNGVLLPRHKTWLKHKRWQLTKNSTPKTKTKTTNVQLRLLSTTNNLHIPTETDLSDSQHHS